MDDVDDDETRFVRLAKTGDQDALDWLIRCHQGRVRAFIGVRLADASLVDDLAQDAFIIACDRIGTFDEGQPFYPWLRGIAHNVLRHHLRKRRTATVDPHDLESLLADAALAHADQVGDHEQQEVVLRDCLSQLSGTTARTVQAHYFDDHSLPTIAAEQGRTAKAVGVMLVRARQWLRACVEAKLGQDVQRGGT